MKFYITTAIDYVNAKPHIGHALEKIQADVLARYHRQKGGEVWFLTGTDEHGVKIVRAAQEAKKNTQEFVDENTQKFKNLEQILNLSFDDFIRTSDQKRHWPGVRKLWQKLYEAGDLYKKKYRGLYCVGHEAFVTEKDLISGKCRDHQKEPEIIEEENWFFKLSKYSKEIESRIKNNELRIIPPTRKNEILSLLNSGLEDISFSRPAKNLSWGIPVPNDSEQTIYVWCDALANYITALGYGQPESSKLPACADPPACEARAGASAGRQAPSSKLKEWWPADVQIVGKDILRFHAAIWPGMLLAAELPLPKAIFVHGFITVDGQKMSKTIGNIIDPVELVKKYGIDPVRYYLLREIPAYDDGDFSYAKFEERYNADLANGLGNLVARVVTLADKFKIQNSKSKITIQNSKLSELCKEVVLKYDATLTGFRFHEALEQIWRLIKFCDGYINEVKPWQGGKDEVIRDLLMALDKISFLLEPFLPDTAKKIQNQLNQTEKTGEILFPRLS